MLSSFISQLAVNRQLKTAHKKRVLNALTLAYYCGVEAVEKPQ